MTASLHALSLLRERCAGPHAGRLLWMLACVAGGALLIGCRAPAGETAHATAMPTAVAVTTADVVERPIVRSLRATGTLTADAQAAAAAEIGGRVIEAPIERGMSVTPGATLVRLSPAEAESQVAEADANVRQIEVRLGIENSKPFDPEQTPEVLDAKSALSLAESEFKRIDALLARGIASKAEHDQRRTQFEAASQRLQTARNTVAQSYRSWQAARARLELARKSLQDTVVRAPFAGLVAERLVNVGDYVAKGAKVAMVVRVDPLRLELTVPQQAVAHVQTGQTVRLTVDAYPNREFEGKLRYISPIVDVNQRALTVEAVVPNPRGELKPGLFASARIERSDPTPALLVPANALSTVAGVSRVFVVQKDHVQERMTAVGETVGELVEITSGVSRGERVATGGLATLSDGALVQVK